MSWFNSRSTKITDGTEFTNGIKLKSNTTVEYHTCEYCGKEILIVDDSERTGWGFYYGNQAVFPKNYLYSPVILSMKRFNGIIHENEYISGTIDKILELKKVTKEERENLIQAIDPFYLSRGNVLANLHSRCHPVGKKHQYDWDLRAGRNAIKLLCNNCFDKTKNRYQVLLDNGRKVAISVVENRKETPNSVLDELGLKGEILGKGAYTGW